MYVQLSEMSVVGDGWSLSAGWILSYVLAQPLMSLNEQCGLPVRTFGDAAVAQAVGFLLVHNNYPQTFCAKFPASGF